MAAQLQAKITPVMLAKKWGMRPQQIFNWIKQGCPSYQVGGKTHVIEEEVKKWDDDRADQRKAKIAHRKANPKGGISEHHKEILALLGKFKPQMIPGQCENCVPILSLMEDGTPIHDINAEGVHFDEKEGVYVKDTLFHVDLSYDSTQSWNGNYVVAWCTECLMNNRYQDMVPAEIAVDVLRGNRPLWFPNSGKYEDQFGKFIASRVEAVDDGTEEELPKEEDEDAGDD